jgi:predicted ATPase
VLAIAERLGDVDFQLRALWGLWIGLPPRGSQDDGLRYAQSYCRIATDAGRPADALVGRGLIGKSRLIKGEPKEARWHLERVRSKYVRRPGDLERFQSDQYVSVRSYLAPTLWILGLPDQAAAMARDSTDDAAALGHPVSMLYALIHAGCPVALLRGDSAASDHAIGQLEALCAVHRDWSVWLHYYQAWRAIDQGDARGGAGVLRATLASRQETAFAFYLAPMLGLLARASLALGDLVESLGVVNRALALAEQHEEWWWVPELLRIRGEALASQDDGESNNTAERELFRSLELARRQSALGWELRTAVSLFRLTRHGHSAEAAEQALATACERFSEGHGTRDFREAEDVLRSYKTVPAE